MDILKIFDYQVGFYFEIPHQKLLTLDHLFTQLQCQQTVIYSIYRHHKLTELV